MKYNPQIHHRRSIRLKDYDYSQCGAYFINVCTKNRECYFEKYPGLKNIVKTEWENIPNQYSHIELDEYVIMPDHFHGIIIINDCRGGVTPPLHGKLTLGQIVAYFKYQSTKLINNIRGTPGVPFWQRNYYEHIIRNEKALYRIRQYIKNNPLEHLYKKNNRNI